jgi:serine/threonine-protein phosphatase 2B catalytic subunit
LSNQDAEKKRQIIRNKIKAIGKIAIVFNTLRQEKENIVELKSILGVSNLPAGTLQNGSEGIKRGLLV